GWCILTHDIDGPFLDTDTYTSEPVDLKGANGTQSSDVPQSGRIYISTGMVTHMARHLGMVPKTDTEPLLKRLAEQEAEIERLDKGLAALGTLKEIGVS